MPDSNALTLADQALISNDPLVKEITKSLHQTWNALKDIPLVTNPSLRQVGTRMVNQANAFPTINWATINEEPVVSKGKPKQYEESMYLIRNKIQVDHVLLDQPNNIVDPVQMQINYFMEALAYDFNDKFIGNDPTSSAAGNDVDCFPGLRYRLTNPEQFDIPAEMSVNGLGASGADLTSTTGTNRFMEKLQNLLDNMNSPDGDGIVIYVSEAMKRAIEYGIRSMGIGAGFDVTKDSFDRPVEMYKGAKIRAVGRKSDGVTHILGPETAAGVPTTSGSLQSIFAVRYGDGYCTGWQPGPFKPTYLGLSKENGVLHNIVFDWGVGMWVPHTRAIGRVYNVKIA